MQCWYFNYRISLSSHFVITSDNCLLSTAFHAWLLNRISRLLGSLPAVTNEAENWELISYWAAQKHPPSSRPLSSATPSDIHDNFIWGCHISLVLFSHKKLRNWRQRLGLCGVFFWCSGECWSPWGKELTAVVKAKSFTAEIWVPEPQSFYCSLYGIQYMPAPTLAYVHLSAHTHTCNQKKVPTHTLPTDTDTFIRLPSFEYTHIHKQW